MEREIKFRAWDKERNFMKYHKLWDNTMPSNWDIHYILMQYTGLKDKNGKEIYEGDIYKMFYKNYLISFYNGSFCSSIIGTKDYTPLNWQITIFDILEDNFSNSIEIIGNIYENPELLK